MLVRTSEMERTYYETPVTSDGFRQEFKIGGRDVGKGGIASKRVEEFGLLVIQHCLTIFPEVYTSVGVCVFIGKPLLRDQSWNWQQRLQRHLIAEQFHIRSRVRLVQVEVNN